MGSAQIQGQLWGTHAEDWAGCAEPSTEPLWRAILAALGVGDGTRLLDVGCGGGGLSSLAASLGATVTGLDASEALVAIAQRRVPDGNFVVGDVESLPFADGEFDRVVACNSIQFASDQVAAVCEARRVLKPDGCFGMGMWCEPERCDMGAVFGALRAFAPPPPRDEPPPLNVRENLMALVRAGGFEIVGEGEVECPFEFQTPDDAWRAFRSAGMLVAVARSAGEDTLRAAVLPRLDPFITDTGGVRMVNWFRYVIGA